MSGVRPADYPPPFATSEAIGPPTDSPDERIDVGILIVGGGPGGLACAVRLGQLLEEHPDALELRVDEPHKLYFKRPGHEPELVVLDSVTGDDGRPRLEPSNVCVELVPIGLERELTIEAEDAEDDEAP